MNKVLAIDVGGTTIKAAVVIDGVILESSREIIHTQDDRESFVTTIHQLIDQFNEVEGIGISIPGIIRAGFLYTAGALTSLANFNLLEQLSVYTDLPISIINDANAATLAEKQGAAKGISDYVLISVGTGIGGGIVINDKIVEGTHGAAGEFGFMSLNFDNEQIEDQSMSLHAGTVYGLVRNYQDLVSDSTIDRDASKIFKKFEDGDPLAKLAVDNFYRGLAEGIININFVVDPQIFVISGGITNRERFLNELNSALQFVVTDIKRYNNFPIPEVRIAEFKSDSSLIGAARYSVISNKNSA